MTRRITNAVRVKIFSLKVIDVAYIKHHMAGKSHQKFSPMSTTTNVFFKQITYIRNEHWFALIIGVITLASQFIIIALAAQFLDPTNLSIFLIGKRFLAWVEPLATFGMGVAIPKYMARARTKDDVDRYWITGLGITVQATIITSGTIIIFRQQLSNLFFNSTTYADMMFPLAFLLLGMACLLACYSYFRGRSRFFAANTVNLFRLFLIPAAGLIFAPTKTVQNTWLVTGGFMVMAFLIILLFTDRPQSTIKWHIIKLHTGHFKELLIFGGQRAVANFILLALVSLPVIAMVQIAGVEQGGALAFSITMLNTVALVASLIDIFLLPHASKMLAENNINVLSRQTWRLLYITILLMLGLTIALEISASWLAQLMLNTTDSTAVATLRLVMLGGIPYGLYLGFRGVIDAKYQSSKVTLNAILSFILFAIIAIGGYIGTNDEQIRINFVIYGFLGGLYFLGGVTIFDLSKILDNKKRPALL